jgi:DNA-binding XRE family transcriptional regulator
MASYTWIVRTLGLTREELANMLGVARRTVGYAIDSWRDEPRIARSVVKRLSDAVRQPRPKPTKKAQPLSRKFLPASTISM